MGLTTNETVPSPPSDVGCASECNSAAVNRLGTLGIAASFLCPCCCFRPKVTFILRCDKITVANNSPDNVFPLTEWTEVKDETKTSNDDLGIDHNIHWDIRTSEGITHSNGPSGSVSGSMDFPQ